ncbi:MAG: signal peptidase II [Ileibacterium sp.]|nr:signal peptidase II [Ileibacterium sp.]
MSKINWKKKGPIALSCLLLIALMVGLDQWTKWAVAQSISLGEKVELIPYFFDLTNVRNTGAAFSFGEGMGMSFFIIVTGIALVAMIYYFFKTDDVGIQWSLALIAAGAIGNLIDRVTLGYVQDFFLFYIFKWPFPVFNVADICVCCGFGLLILCMIMDEWKEKHGGKGKVSNA